MEYAHSRNHYRRVKRKITNQSSTYPKGNILIRLQKNRAASAELERKVHGSYAAFIQVAREVETVSTKTAEIRNAIDAMKEIAAKEAERDGPTSRNAEEKDSRTSNGEQLQRKEEKVQTKVNTMKTKLDILQRSQQLTEIVEAQEDLAVHIAHREFDQAIQVVIQSNMIPSPARQLC